MLDVFTAMPVLPPDEAAEGGLTRDKHMRPGSLAAREYWSGLVRDAESCVALGGVLLSYAHQLPKSAFRKGFRKWWLADGGLDEGKAKVDKELRKLGAGGDKEREKRDNKEPQKPKELPPAQSDSAHQVHLRLHLLDAGLAYA